MQTGAIICEYNPLHNGHAYQIQETKKQGITHLIAVLSDDFVQRGDTALLNKFDRADLALQAGADLVIELPVPYSCASAEFYAKGAVQILHDLNITDYLSFGCSGNPEKLNFLAQLLIKNQFSDQIQKFLKSGCSYPSAIYQSVCEIAPETAGLLLDSNNLLALEYLKAMHRQHVNFQPLMIQRNSVMHDSMITSGNFASASFIRNRFFHHENYQNYIPDFTEKMLSERQEQGRIADFYRLEKIILYQMRMLSDQDLLSLPDMTPELAGRFRKADYENTLDDFLNTIKSRCFTMARIRRIIFCALAGIRKQDFKIPVPYARILAFNQNGTQLLKKIKLRSHIPVSTSLADLRKLSPDAERFVQLECNTANLYGLALNQIHSAESEFRTKIYLKK